METIWESIGILMNIMLFGVFVAEDIPVKSGTSS